jgi:hypothetical protein
MRRGAWHQCGDRSQRMATELLDEGAGVGVVISPRDVSPGIAAKCSESYRDLDAEVLIDPQFHVPDSQVGHLPEWEINEFRSSVASLNALGVADQDQLTKQLLLMNSSVGASAVIAPAVVYEAGRPEILDLNRALFRAGKRAAEELGIPVYATVVVGRSAASADGTFMEAISAGSSLAPDGWYFAMEFGAARVANNQAEALRGMRGMLALAATGQPVLQAFAGPMAILGVASGVTGVGVGYSQNLWQFSRARWEPAASGGGGDAPARLFSEALWGTMVYPDEFATLDPELAERLVSTSPFAPNVSGRAPHPPVARWAAGQHLAWMICEKADHILALDTVAERIPESEKVLEGAVGILGEIAAAGVTLKDGTGSYQRPWLNALLEAQEKCRSDYDYLAMLEEGER